jgi:hypothetical protein
MNPAKIAEKLFCPDGKKLFLEHVIACAHCRKSIIAVLDMFPFFTMGKTVTEKDLEKLLNQLKGEAAHG